MPVVVFVENVNDPVTLWLPMVLLLVLTTPFWAMIPMKGLEVVVPFDVTPVRLTLAMVLLEIVETALPVGPLNTIPANFPVEPVRAYVPVPFEAEKPMTFPVMVKLWAPPEITGAEL